MHEQFHQHFLLSLFGIKNRILLLTGNVVMLRKLFSFGTLLRHKLRTNVRHSSACMSLEAQQRTHESCPSFGGDQASFRCLGDTSLPAPSGQFRPLRFSSAKWQNTSLPGRGQHHARRGKLVAPLEVPLPPVRPHKMRGNFGRGTGESEEVHVVLDTSGSLIKIAVFNTHKTLPAGTSEQGRASLIKGYETPQVCLGLRQGNRWSKTTYRQERPSRRGSQRRKSSERRPSSVPQTVFVIQTTCPAFLSPVFTEHRQNQMNRDLS